MISIAFIRTQLPSRNACNLVPIEGSPLAFVPRDTPTCHLVLAVLLLPPAECKFSVVENSGLAENFGLARLLCQAETMRFAQALLVLLLLLLPLLAAHETSTRRDSSSVRETSDIRF